VCSSTGEGFIQSIEEEVLKIDTQPRELERDSHIINTNNKTDRKEISEPKDETTFHDVKASG